MTAPEATTFLGAQQVPVPDGSVREAIDLIDDAGIASVLEHRLDADRRSRAGRPATLTVRALFVGLLLAASIDGNVRLTTASDMLHYRISPARRDELDVAHRALTVDGREAGYAALRRLFHRVVAQLDDSPHPKNRRRPEADQEALTAVLPPEVCAQRRKLRNWTGNRLLAASLGDELATLLHSDETTGTCVDATVIETHARGPSKRTGLTSADPDAGWYRRDDTTRSEQTPQTRTRTTPNKDRHRNKLVYGFEVTTIVNGATRETDAHLAPPVVVGAYTLERPGHRPGEAAIEALTQAHANEWPTGLLAGDRAYNNSDPDRFQLPARALGYQLLFDYKIDQLGIQAEYSGALMIEGTWYCPSIPEPLINATLNYRNGEISEAEWHAAIDARRTFELRPKQGMDAEGHQRILCPAESPSPKLNCVLKPESLGDVRRLTIHPEPGPVGPSQVCRQKSMTIPPEAGAKHAQAYPYGTPEWERSYHTLRNGVEGMNGYLKDPTNANLENSGTRCVRGSAAVHLLVGFQLAATNLRKQHAWREARGTYAAPTRRVRPRKRTTKSVTDWTPVA